MFGKLGDMMGKLQEMKAKTDEINEKLKYTNFNIEGAGGDIKITINGLREIKELKIADALQHSNNEELTELLIVTLNKAIAKAHNTYEEEMKKVAGAMLPGMT